MQTQKLFGISITSEYEDNILKYILKTVENGSVKLKVFTPNPEILMHAKNHPTLKKMVNEADINLPDGVGLIAASRFLGLSLKKRIAGIDFMELLCKAVSDYNLGHSQTSKKLISMGFLGGRANVAKRASECLQKKYSGLQISYAENEWNEAKLKGKKADILFVAMGYPKQEIWITEHIDKIPVTVAMGVGGSFDFLAGDVPRAPQLLRVFGLEWLFRLVVQPWRWKRQLQLVPFVFLVFKEFYQLRILGKTA